MPSEYPTFAELMDHEREQTPIDRLLVQAIAALSTEGRYASMHPEDVYNEVVRQCKEVHQTSV